MNLNAFAQGHRHNPFVQNSIPTWYAPTFSWLEAKPLKVALLGAYPLKFYLKIFFVSVFESVNFIFFSCLLLPCYYEGPEQKTNKVFLSAVFEDRNHWSALKHRGRKNSERTSKYNPPSSLSCIVQIHHATENPHSKVNSPELYWRVLWSIQAKRVQFYSTSCTVTANYNNVNRCIF